MTDEKQNGSTENVMASTWSTVAAVAATAASKSPDMREAGTSLARSAKLVARTIETALIPLAIVNYGIEKARAYFEERFGPALKDLASAIPSENLREPKASVAGPALQGLAFAHDEPALEAMYLNLLATAMDGRTGPDTAHPAFVEIIKQLSANEAAVLKNIFLATDLWPVASMWIESASHADGFSGDRRTILRHVMNIRSSDTLQFVETPDLSAMIDNFQRLGLINVDFGRQMAGENAYDWVDQHPMIDRLREQHQREGATVALPRGLIERTDFGRKFAIAVGI